MISAIKLKKCVAGASILDNIIGKLCYKKKPCLIIWLEVDKGLEVSFYYTILPFNLTIYLWIEGGGESLLDIEEIA